MKKSSYKSFCKSLEMPKKLIAVTLIISVLHIACSNITLLLLQDIVNRAVESAGFSFDAVVLAAVLLIFVFVFLSAFADFLFNILSFAGGQGARRGLYIKILRSPALTKKYQSGDLLGCAFDDAATIGANFSGRKIHAVTGVLEIAVILGILFYYSWIIGLLTAAVYPLFFYINIKISRGMAHHNKKVLTYSGHARQTFLQGLKGIFLLRHLKKENYYHGKFKRGLKNIAKTRRQIAFLSAVNLATRIFVAVSLPALMVIIGLIFASGGHVRAGTVLLIYALITKLLEPANRLNLLMSGYIEDKKAYERVKPVFEYTEPADGEIQIDKIESIEMHITEFAYGRDKSVLTDFNFSFTRGDRVGILGESGGGKSTILKLLMRQEELKEGQGSIKINGTDLRGVNSLSLYDKMLLSSQSNFLFEGTLTENLCMGTRFSDEEIDEVISVCCLEKFVGEYGFDREIKEDSANISGGQLQRICLARVLLRKPELLLLDEPTAALDNEISGQLIRNLEDFMNKYNTSLIVVTHKESVLSVANKVIRL